MSNAYCIIKFVVVFWQLQHSVFPMHFNPAGLKKHLKKEDRVVSAIPIGAKYHEIIIEKDDESQSYFSRFLDGLFG